MNMGLPLLQRQAQAQRFSWRNLARIARHLTANGE
jgi:hypothetical protein